MRRFTWVIALVMCLSLVLAGCGKKDASSIVKDLDTALNKLDSYQGVGTMVLHTGQEPQEYHVEVWYQNPHYYRISLKNEKKDITQIVLRNDDGVFVLTPHLNKSFRFQSDWPENQGQVYLYQSLVQSILLDNDRQFTTEEKSYVFDVLANYHNGSLARQKIWLDQTNYAPQHVEVSDSSGNVMVKVDFAQFEFGKKFEKDSFDMQRNMTSWKIESLPTMAPLGETNAAENAEGKTDVSAKGTDAAATSNMDTSSAATSSMGASSPVTDTANSNANAGSTNGATASPSTNQNAGSAAVTPESSSGKAAKKEFGVIEPYYTPAGVKRQDVTDIKLGEEAAVMLRYSGTYNYTLIESHPETQTVSLLPADVVDLGYTLGVITGEEKKTLIWTHDGVEFRLSTADLPVSEMINVAQSVQGQTGK
ncbi:hypothetical protein [Paenibacillus xerothermodurans]|uniref:DUF4367 domain-containing protein n=1 Tax=Paenibacillus xerothermodurans TaxID=1977292 RepID=A0A2W1N8U3_PAEXE|nr:hypothetical protein [Paenibacillus xerothermodurans]PZE20807.1 hypothetical protein CBW46_011680 [Paenibacillus xerothermodurans]